MRGLVISDLHFCHNKVSGEEISFEILNTLKNSGKLDKIDYLFILGDVYDKISTLSNKDAVASIRFGKRLNELSKKHDFKIIGVYGTTSHEMDQLDIFIEQFDNIIYVDKLTIKNIDGMDILFIPDNLSISHNEAEVVIQGLLDNANIDKVDLILGHGLTDFQLPKLDIPSYSSKFLLSICKGFILFGHDHTHKYKDRILVPGSVPRLKHGEEEDKGILFIEQGEDIDQWLFIKNIDAIRFITSNLGDKVNIKALEKQLKDEPYCSHIKFKVKNISHDTKVMLRAKFRGYASLIIEDEKVKKLSKTEEIKELKTLTINKENIESLVLKELGSIIDRPLALTELRRVI